MVREKGRDAFVEGFAIGIQAVAGESASIPPAPPETPTLPGFNSYLMGIRAGIEARAKIKLPLSKPQDY